MKTLTDFIKRRFSMRHRIIQKMFFWMNRMVRRIFPHCMTFCQTSSVLCMSVYLQRANVLLSHRSAPTKPKWTESAVPLCRIWVCMCDYVYGYALCFQIGSSTIQSIKIEKKTQPCDFVRYRTCRQFTTLTYSTDTNRYCFNLNLFQVAVLFMYFLLLWSSCDRCNSRMWFAEIGKKIKTEEKKANKFQFSFSPL